MVCYSMLHAAQYLAEQIVAFPGVLRNAFDKLVKLANECLNLLDASPIDILVIAGGLTLWQHW